MKRNILFKQWGKTLFLQILESLSISIEVNEKIFRRSTAGPRALAQLVNAVYEALAGPSSLHTVKETGYGGRKQFRPFGQ